MGVEQVLHEIAALPSDLAPCFNIDEHFTWNVPVYKHSKKEAF